MRPEMGINSLPGQQSVADQDSYAFLKDADHKITLGIKIDSGSVDSTHTGKTGYLRPGLVLVRVEAAGAYQGKFVPLDHAQAPIDANIVQACVLDGEEINMLSKDGSTAEDKAARGVVHGFIDESQTWWSGANAARIAAAKAKMPLNHFYALP